jgi:hypothetical protein
LEFEDILAVICLVVMAVGPVLPIYLTSERPAHVAAVFLGVNLSTTLATQRIDQAAALGDILCKCESRLSSLLNAHSLAFSVIKRAISFGLNLHRPGYDILRSPLGFSDDIASRGLRLSYDALSFSAHYGNRICLRKVYLRGNQGICWRWC